MQYCPRKVHIKKQGEAQSEKNTDISQRENHRVSHVERSVKCSVVTVKTFHVERFYKMGLKSVNNWQSDNWLKSTKKVIHKFNTN